MSKEATNSQRIIHYDGKGTANHLVLIIKTHSRHSSVKAHQSDRVPQNPGNSLPSDFHHRDVRVNSWSLAHSLHTAMLMDGHVTQGRAITLVPHTPLETRLVLFPTAGIAELAILQLASSQLTHQPMPAIRQWLPMTWFFRNLGQRWPSTDRLADPLRSTMSCSYDRSIVLSNFNRSPCPGSREFQFVVFHKLTHKRCCIVRNSWVIVNESFMKLQFVELMKESDKKWFWYRVHEGLCYFYFSLLV